jgi:LmbE family N-acetylglucosaminyl deacetylase
MSETPGRPSSVDPDAGRAAGHGNWHAGRRLLVVLAHPDDESLACGGTIALCADSGVEVTLACATRGGAGSFDASLVRDRAALMNVRVAELGAACAVLGVGRIEQLDFEDGMLPWLPPAEVSQAIARILVATRPDAIITFGRDGLYWHPDHIAIGERTREAVASVPDCGAALYCVTLPPAAMAEIAAGAGHDVAGAGNTFWGIRPEIFGLGAPEPTLVVDVRPVLARKIAAILCHRSQLAPPNPLRDLAPAHPHPALGIEHFHLADSSPAGTSFLDAFHVR